MEVSIEQLVARARLHDAEAFAELIRRTEGVALSIAYAHTRSSSDARDVVQDAYLRAWQKLDSLQDAARFSPWLGRMVRNLAIDLKRRRKTVPLEPAFDPAGDVGASKPIEDREHKNQIDKALQSLDDLSRTCVVLRYYENLSSKEIGELLDITPAAVDMRLSRARNQLKERLAGVVS